MDYLGKEEVVSNKDFNKSVDKMNLLCALKTSKNKSVAFDIFVECSLNVGCPLYSCLCRASVWTRGQLLEVHVFLGQGWNLHVCLSGSSHLLVKKRRTSQEQRY